MNYFFFVKKKNLILTLCLINPFLQLWNQLLTDGFDEEEALRLLIKTY